MTLRMCRHGGCETQATWVSSGAYGGSVNNVPRGTLAVEKRSYDAEFKETAQRIVIGNPTDVILVALA